jgi:hypothetical protein
MTNDHREIESNPPPWARTCSALLAVSTADLSRLSDGVAEELAGLQEVAGIVAADLAAGRPEAGNVISLHNAIARLRLRLEDVETVIERTGDAIPWLDYTHAPPEGRGQSVPRSNHATEPRPALTFFALVPTDYPASDFPAVGLTREAAAEAGRTVDAESHARIDAADPPSEEERQHATEADATRWDVGRWIRVSVASLEDVPLAVRLVTRRADSDALAARLVGGAE